MAVWIWGIVLLLIIFCLSLYIKVTVTVIIREDESFQGVSFKIHSRFYKLKRQFDFTDPHLRLIESILLSAISKIDIPPRNPTTFLPEDEEYLSIFRGHPIKYIALRALEDGKVLNFGLKYLIVDNLEWKSVVGTQDALHTALGTGACWALKGAIIGVLSSRCRLGRLVLDVRPDFMTPAFFSRLTCILKIRTVHIIIIEVFIIATKVRWCIDGDRTGTRTGAVQTSH